MTKRLFLSLFFVSCSLTNTHRTTSLKTLFQTELTVKNKIFKVWLAIDPKQKSEGLSLLSPDEVSTDQGMLFIYPYEEKLSFWMKNTFFDLDIAYVKSDGVVVNIYTMPKMLRKNFLSSKKVRYVLELRGGIFKKIGLKVGDKISIPQQVRAFSKP